MFKLMEHRYFDNFILAFIGISSVALAFENPLNDPEGITSKILFYMDITSTAVFTIEVVIKVIAVGFIVNGKTSYIRNAWNIMDFIIVIISIISLFPIEAKISVFKIIRMARLLRPLRIISKNQNLKLSIQALIVAIPAISSLLVIVLLVMFIFAIVAVNLFKGKSFYCETSTIEGLSPKQLEEQIITRLDCLRLGGRWNRYHHHFDHIGSAMLQMIVMS